MEEQSYTFTHPQDHTGPVTRSLYFYLLLSECGPGRSVGIATDYRLDAPGSNSGGDGFFRPVQTSPGAHRASCTMGTGSFPGVKCGRGVLLTTHPLLVPRSWKSRAITLPTLWATPGLWRDHFTFIIIIIIIIRYISAVGCCNPCVTVLSWSCSITWDLCFKLTIDHLIIQVFGRKIWFVVESIRFVQTAHIVFVSFPPPASVSSKGNISLFHRRTILFHKISQLTNCVSDLSLVLYTQVKVKVKFPL
jgi:hypothetical protein